MRNETPKPGQFLIASACSIAFLALLMNCSPAVAQNFKQLQPGTSNGRPVNTWAPLALSEEGKAVAETLSGAQPFNPAAFDKFFNELMFPLFAQYQEVKVGAKMVSPLVGGTGGVESPAIMRQRFKQNYVQKATNPQIHQHLIDITLTKMNEIASGEFHPVCRYNAMLMIADLNEVEPDRPYKKALDALLKGATASTSIDAVRVPALCGLVRQAHAGIAGAASGEVINAMLALQAQRIPPADRTQDGHDWICRRAIDVLEAIGSPGPNGAVLTALMKTADDPAASIAVRTTAARAIGNIAYSPPQNFNAAPWIKSLGKLAIDCYKAELANAAGQHTPIVADRLKQQLTEIRTGLAGPDGTKGMIVLSAGAKPNQDLARLLVSQIDNLIAKCSTPLAATTPPKIVSISTPLGTSDFMALPPDPQKPLAEALQKAGDELEAALQRGPGAAPAAPAAPGALGGAPGGQSPF